MKFWIKGLLFVCLIVASGFFFTQQANSESPNLPNTNGSLTTAPSVDGNTALSADGNTGLSANTNTPLLTDEKVSAAALTCTIIDFGDYVVDLRLKNSGIETRTIIFDPSGTKLDLLPKKTYRFDLHLAKEVNIINILADDGTELHVQTPPCTTGGSSGSNVLGLDIQEPTTQSPAPSKKTPPPPVPELSPLVLTLAGISGLLLLSRTRKN